MSISEKEFGTMPNGDSVNIYTITNNNEASISILNLGGAIHSIYMPNRDGVLEDVVLGFDKVESYLNSDLGYQGMLVGRFANRIRNAEFSMDGKTYKLPVNQGSWTLHGGGRFSFSLWDVIDSNDNSLTVQKFSPDGDDGFPGNFTMTVKYSLDDENTIKIKYTVSSDKKTVANPTNHVYFNLSANPNKTIEDHFLKVNADYVTETDNEQLPTGKLIPVKGTMMDFTYSHKIGDKIDESCDVVIPGVGYDNNYCLNKKYPYFDEAAVLYDEESGRQLSIYTDMPGIQVYCGGWLKKEYAEGKGENIVKYRRGIALETQFYPDSVHFPDEFPFEYVYPGEEFTSTTEFHFSVR